jgi:hypothetical protein
MVAGQMKSPSRMRSQFDRRGRAATFLLAFFLIAQFARGQSQSQFPRNDVQGWVDMVATHPLREKVQLTLNGGLRVSDDAGHLVYRRVGVGLDWKVSKYLTLSPYYNFYDTDSSPLRESRENRTALAATAGLPLGRWTIQDRNLYERRFLIGEQTWRYRNRLEVARNVRLAHSRLRLFVWDEVFYDSVPRAWARNRAAIGGSKALSRRLTVDLYYVRQNDSHARPGDVNAIGALFHARF